MHLSGLQGDAGQTSTHVDKWVAEWAMTDGNCDVLTRSLHGLVVPGGSTWREQGLTSVTSYGAQHLWWSLYMGVGRSHSSQATGPQPPAN